MEKINDRYTQITSGAQLVNLFKAGEPIVYMEGDSALPADFGRPALKMIHEAEQGKYYIDTKPKKQVVDMEPFVRNGLDCVFTDAEYTYMYFSPLRQINSKGFYDKDDSVFERCRPRLNHPFIWDGNLEIPEGLDVVIGKFDHLDSKWIWVPLPEGPPMSHVAKIVGCKDGYCFPGCE